MVSMRRLVQQRIRESSFIRPNVSVISRRAGSIIRPLSPLQIRSFNSLPSLLHQQPLTESKTTLGKCDHKEARLLIGFTCKVCSTRSHKFMSKTAYTKGVVIIKCDGCKSLHLMADHLGWFDTTKKAQGTIEEIMAAKGETVTRIKFNPSDIQTNGREDKAAIDELFESATPEVMKEIEDGLLEWLPKNEEDLLSSPLSSNSSSASS